MAVFLLAQFVFGWWLGDVPRNTPARSYFINLHKSTGLIIGLLILLRLWWRIQHAPPAFPVSMPQWHQRLATSSHTSMYACMFLLPLSGYLASNFSPYGVKFFNVLALPAWGPDHKIAYSFFNRVHQNTSLLMVTLVLLHTTAALWHATRQDGALSRMWPRRS